MSTRIYRLMTDLDTLFAALADPTRLRLLALMREGEVCGRRWRDLDKGTRPLWCLTVDSQYDGAPLKTDRPRVVPVHPALIEMLDMWWSDGYQLLFKHRPTGDDFIIPSRGGEPHTKSSAYKMWRRLLLVAGVTNRSLHSTRHTFISLCRRGGARKDVLERITHNAVGDIVDGYTLWDWKPLCEAVECFGRGQVTGDAARPYDAHLEGSEQGNLLARVTGKPSPAERPIRGHEQGQDLPSPTLLPASFPPVPATFAQCSNGHITGHTES